MDEQRQALLMILYLLNAIHHNTVFAEASINVKP
jgi:hypothetical protein